MAGVPGDVCFLYLLYCHGDAFQRGAGQDGHGEGDAAGVADHERGLCTVHTGCHGAKLSLVPGRAFYHWYWHYLAADGGESLYYVIRTCRQGGATDEHHGY